MPLDGKCNRRCSQDAEVVCIVRVLPDIFAREDQVFPECLLDSCMEFIAPARIERRRYAWDKVRDYGKVATTSRKYEVLVKGCFQDSRIGNAQNCAAGFDVISDPNARFRFTMNG